MTLPFTPTKVHLQSTVSTIESQKLPSRCAWTSWSHATVASLAALRTTHGPSLLDVFVVPHLNAMRGRSLRGSSCIPVSRRFFCAQRFGVFVAKPQLRPTSSRIPRQCSESWQIMHHGRTEKPGLKALGRCVPVRACKVLKPSEELGVPVVRASAGLEL